MIGIDLAWLVITPIGMWFVALIGGKQKLETMKDMESDRIYRAALYASILLFLIGFLCSGLNFPHVILELVGKLTSAVVGIFLAAVIAKITMDIATRSVKLISKKTLSGLVVLLLTGCIVFCIDSIPEFRVYLSNYFSDQTLDDEALTLIANITMSLTIFLWLCLHKPLIYGFKRNNSNRAK